MLLPPPSSTLFPYTTLFRSVRHDDVHAPVHVPRFPSAHPSPRRMFGPDAAASSRELARLLHVEIDRKSTRLNSSHSSISYAVFCLKKKTIAGRVFPMHVAVV